MIRFVESFFKFLGAKFKCGRIIFFFDKWVEFCQIFFLFLRGNFMVFGRSSKLCFYFVDNWGYLASICTLGQLIMGFLLFRLICYFWLEGF